MSVKVAGALILCAGLWAQEFEFDVWVRPPSREVYALTADAGVQAMLRAVRDEALTCEEIGARTGRPCGEVREKMTALEKFGLASAARGRWLSNIPMYEEPELREAERIGIRYARMEAAIIERALPRLKAAYEKTAPAKAYPWSGHSLMVAGALLADFCVFDRAPFEPGAAYEWLQPPLQGPEGLRWGYTGYGKTGARFPTRRWKFGQNVDNGEPGGMARFAYSTEQRQETPAHPQTWARRPEGMILFALVDGPLTEDELRRASGLAAGAYAGAMAALREAAPPAVVEREGKLALNLPVFTERELDVLLAVCDPVARRILREVSQPNFDECRMRAKELGMRWPLPRDTYVRDKALQMLIERGLVSAPVQPPVPWNAGVWGWRGLMAQHDQVTRRVQPDPFLKSPVGGEERKAIASFNQTRARVLEGARFHDLSTPWYAYLTRLASDPKQFADLKSVTLMRVRMPAAQPKDEDLVPVFVRDPDGMFDALAFVHWHGAWHYVGSSGRISVWREDLDPYLKTKLHALRTAGR